MRNDQPIRPEPSRRAFSLIELLVVAAIISILASIAIPNFLDAQTRAKVARVKNDMRTMKTAIEAYHVDHNSYPIRRNTRATETFRPTTPQQSKRTEQLSAITTPVAYITTLVTDIFDSNTPAPYNLIDYYDSVQASWLVNASRIFDEPKLEPGEVGWILVSVGPDTYLGALDNSCECPSTFQLRGSIRIAYDPTNGSVSIGNLYAGQIDDVDRAGGRLMRQMRP